MGMKRSSMATNVQAEQDGVWTEYRDGVELLIARANNPRYNDLFRRLTKPYERQIRTEQMSEEMATSIMAECMAQTILLGWRGIEHDDGTPMAYSVDEARAMLLDPELHDFRRDVKDLSEQRDRYLKAAVQADAVTLGNVSSGSASGVLTSKDSLI